MQPGEINNTNDIEYVRASPGGRQTLRFGGGGVEFLTCPVTWRDWRRWAWLSLAAGMALAWVGVLLRELGAPEWAPIACAAPVGVPFLIFMLGAILVGLFHLVTFGLFLPEDDEVRTSRIGAWVDARSTPRRVLGGLPAHAVREVRAERRWRRTVVLVRFGDGRTVRYTRWGWARSGRRLAESFQVLAHQPVRR